MRIVIRGMIDKNPWKGRAFDTLEGNLSCRSETFSYRGVAILSVSAKCGSLPAMLEASRRRAATHVAYSLCAEAIAPRRFKERTDYG